MQGYYKLKDIREKWSYSHQDMANFLNVSKCFYWQIENGTRTLYYELAIKIADIFHVKPDYLFFK